MQDSWLPFYLNSHLFYQQGYLTCLIFYLYHYLTQQLFFHIVMFLLYHLETFLEDVLVVELYIDRFQLYYLLLKFLCHLDNVWYRFLLANGKKIIYHFGFYLLFFLFVLVKQCTCYCSYTNSRIFLLVYVGVAYDFSGTILSIFPLLYQTCISCFFFP